MPNFSDAVVEKLNVAAATGVRKRGWEHRVEHTLTHHYDDSTSRRSSKGEDALKSGEYALRDPDSDFQCGTGTFVCHVRAALWESSLAVFTDVVSIVVLTDSGDAVQSSPEPSSSSSSISQLPGRRASTTSLAPVCAHSLRSRTVATCRLCVTSSLHSRRHLLLPTSGLSDARPSAEAQADSDSVPFQTDCDTDLLAGPATVHDSQPATPNAMQWKSIHSLSWWETVADVLRAGPSAVVSMSGFILLYALLVSVPLVWLSHVVAVFVWGGSWLPDVLKPSWALSDLPAVLLTLYACADLVSLLRQWYLASHVQPAVTYPGKSLPRTDKEREQVLFGLVLKGKDPKVFFSNWFFGAKFELIFRENLVDWFAFAFCAKPAALLTTGEKQAILRLIDRMCQHFGLDIQPGLNRAVRCMTYQHDAIRVIPRPLVIYFFTETVFKGVTAALLYVLGYTAGSAGALHFHHFAARPSKHPMRLYQQKPLVFIHGIGVGFFPYVPFLLYIHLFARSRPSQVLLISLPSISMGYPLTVCPSRVNHKDATVEALQQLLDQHHIRSANFMGHSYGTFVLSWIMSRMSHLVHKMVAVDPVCFEMHGEFVLFFFSCRLLFFPSFSFFFTRVFCFSLRFRLSRTRSGLQFLLPPTSHPERHDHVLHGIN